MTIGLLKTIANRRPQNARLLGMDVGSKTLGLAVSDHLHNVATPLTTIKRTKFTADLPRLETIVRDYEIGGFVLGLPLNMDGSEGKRCQAIRDFAAELARYPAIVGKNPWIALWDERLSTHTVEDFVHNHMDINVSKAKARGIVDKLAAQHILQGALNYLTKSA